MPERKTPVTGRTGGPFIAKSLDATPVTASAGGPYACKPCAAHDAQLGDRPSKARRYFGKLLNAGEAIPACPNCGSTITPTQAATA